MLQELFYRNICKITYFVAKRGLITTLFIKFLSFTPISRLFYWFICSFYCRITEINVTLHLLKDCIYE